MPYTYEYPRPSVTTDVVLFKVINDTLELLLIQRAHEPFRHHWALPGGFLDIDEVPVECARRELKEETGLRVEKLIEVGAFAEVDRDPRGRVISIAFAGLLQTRAGVEGRSDAAAAQWFDLKKLPKLAFDHQNILSSAKERICIDLKAGKNEFQISDHQVSLFL